MRTILTIFMMLGANLAHAITPLGNTEGYMIVDLDKQHKFTLIEGALVDCVLNVGDPGLKIETCKLENAEIKIDSHILKLDALVRNFMPLVEPGRTMYQYQYIGTWEKQLPDFTFRHRAVITLNLPGLNTPRFGGYIEIRDVGINWSIAAKKS